MLRTSLALVVLFLASQFANAATEPQRVGATFGRIYVPGGFDSNDQIQFVGEGMFRNTCYRPAPGAITVNDRTHVITVGPVAYEYKGFCLQVILPFQRTVEVGILKPGNYKIVQNNGSVIQDLGSLTVRPALTDAPDDYLYAPINQAFFKQNFADSTVTLTGEFTNECMKIDHVRTTVERDVIVLQPIAKVVSQPVCKDGRFPFEETVQLPSIAPGRYLLHVRSMNGNAVNNLVNVELNSH